jgi:ATP-dependent exoDNAse (exonuclease V) beta subunit
MSARDAIKAQFPENIVHISANFRSGGKILEHVDECFADPLRLQHGEYAKHQATVEGDEERIQSIVRLPYAVAQSKYTADARAPEAKAVAELCASLIGNVRVRRSNGDIVTCEPGDIALLAPTGTELWMYERELESRGLPVASQAVRNLYRRQEAQDFICLARALADNRDTLALGALLRGPIVGVTERDLLDVTEQLRKFDEHAVLSMMTDLAAVKHPLLLDVMKILQGLFRKRRSTTPHALLSEAIERLHVLAGPTSVIAHLPTSISCSAAHAPTTCAGSSNSRSTS